MVCKSCGKVISDGSSFCVYCGADTKTGVSNTQVYQTYSQINYEVPKKSVPSSQIINIIGFISSILGIFCFSVVFLPASLIICGVNYRNDNTKKLAVSGLIISIIAMVIKICVFISENGPLPSWLSGGIFS